MSISQFYKQISILIVEDDYSIRESLKSFFANIFKEVYCASNGNEGYELYLTQKENISIIISDINMPELNGLEMIAKIKKISDNDISFILLTAYSEPHYMLDAIKLGVSHYSVKPIVIKDVMVHLNEICQKQYNAKQLLNKTNELHEYLEIVNQVAIVSTTDENGIIVSVNDIFCDTSGYTKEELIGKPHNIIRHPDTPKELFADMWQTIKNGHTWRGKLKNKSKDGDCYYVFANVFPLFEDDNITIKGFMGVRFLTTEIETEKRNFKQKVIKNIINSKSIMNEYEKKISLLETEQKELLKKLDNNNNNDLILDTLNKERAKNSRLLAQIKHYEEELETNFEKNFQVAQKARESELKIIDENKQLKVKYDSTLLTIQSMKTELSKKEELIRSYHQRIEAHLKTIENLKDVIKHRESQLHEMIH
jgi:PAS domain S-box-containing protein